MSLVDYSSSSSDSAAVELIAPRKKRKTSNHVSDLPPLPPAFHDLYASSARLSTADDPSLHGGRKRQTPHVEGNWPTHVYLEWHPTEAQSELLSRLIEAARSKSHAGKDGEADDIHSLLWSPLSTSLPLHISLSRPLVLRTEQRDDFLQAISRAIHHAKSDGGTPCTVRAFEVAFTSLVWHPNHDRSRWFLALSAGRPRNDELNRLLWACNSVARASAMGMLYQDSEIKEHTQEGDLQSRDCSDCFHVSVAWALKRAQPGEAFKNADRQTQELMEELKKMTVVFDAVKVKIGNAVHAVELGKKPANSSY